MPKAEFGRSRHAAESLADIGAGRQLMMGAFGDRLAPIFVPPWNRVASAVRAALPELGFSGLSSYTGEDTEPLPVGLTAVNADVLNWEEPHDGGVAVLPLQVIADKLASIMQSQRENSKSGHEPIGILTHHRAMNNQAWDVVAAAIAAISSSGIAEWPHPATLFGLVRAGTDEVTR